MVNRPGPAIVIGLAILVTWSGCDGGGGGGDSGAASPEPEPEPAVEPPGNAPLEPPASASEAQIRAVLAEEYLDEPWYARVQAIDASASRVTVIARLTNNRKSRGTAWEICGAVLTSPRVSDVIVRYSPAKQVVCR